ncbi:MAG: FeoA family protein [Oscillospiraceae bacterium]
MLLIMESLKTLTELDIGQTANIVQLLSTGSMRRRLQDLGMIEGTIVECLHKSPCGDPIAYLIRGAAIALRTEDSSNILISI